MANENWAIQAEGGHDAQKIPNAGIVVENSAGSIRLTVTAGIVRNDVP